MIFQQGERDRGMNIKKLLAVGIILLFTGTVFTPSITASEPTSNQTVYYDENGTLSGYVKDSAMNPIEGARVRVYFHETYEENYTDSTGYYHVTNIPICYCLKNATVSKKGYRSECVLLSINETTTHNFVLTFLGKTLYVGGSGPGNYSRIQDAVDNAANGDTVYVYPGFYVDEILTHHSCVYINKSISLIGEDKNTTIIDGSHLHTVLGIMANNVLVHGFTIQNSGRSVSSPPPSGISVNPPSAGLLENITVSDTIITENKVGLRIYKSGNCIFHNNIISNNNYGCSLRDNKYNCSLINNNIFDNEVGVYSSLSYCVPWIVSNNIQKNDFGIYIVDSDNNIHFNNFIDNQINAKYTNDLQLLEIWKLLKGNNWYGNYWDNWNYILPKPIVGRTYLYMYLYIPPFNPIEIPLGTYPSIGFDWHPTQEPYDIS